MPSWPIPKWTNDIKYDLSRIDKILSLLDNPHKKMPPIIHIAGTNGKGSTVAFLRSIFQKSGYSAHAYTSPHLRRFNERIVVSDSQISDDYLSFLCDKVKIVCDSNDISPSFFEATTAVAFIAFAENKADVLLLEVGMGGRLDATNIIENPFCCIITPISYDHMSYLGDTLELIAKEKAAIIKKSSFVFISKQEEVVANVLFKECEEKNVLHRAYEYNFGTQKLIDKFNIKSEQYDITIDLPGLLGDHQIINAATAIDCSKIVLSKKYRNITDETIEEGIKSASWSGRIQKIDLSKTKFSSKLVSDCFVYADGAHNSAGAVVLSDFVRNNMNKSDVCVIIGMTKNRNVTEFVSKFDGVVSEFYGVMVLSEPFSYSSQKMCEMLLDCSIKSNKAESLEEAIELASKKYNNIIVTGSLFLIADLFNLLEIVVR